jgi:uncharacterized membrane protein YebE (DUF533 family)
MTDSRVASLAALLREIDGDHTLGAGALAEALIARGVTVGSRLGGPSPAAIDGLAREVWKSWRAGMAVQNRPVAVERTSWDTLSAEDRELDHYIAGWLLSFLNYKSGVRAGSEETP